MQTVPNQNWTCLKTSNGFNLGRFAPSPLNYAPIKVQSFPFAEMYPIIFQVRLKVLRLWERFAHFCHRTGNILVVDTVRLENKQSNGKNIYFFVHADFIKNW